MSYGRLQGSVQISALVTGDRGLDRALAALDQKVERKVTRKALRAGAKLVKATARTLAPVRSGLLRSALAVRAGKARRRGEVLVNVELVKREAIVAASGDNFYYPAAVEYGRKAKHAKNKAGAGKAVAGSHWMRRAKAQADSTAKVVVMAALRSGVEQAAREVST